MIFHSIENSGKKNSLQERISKLIKKGNKKEAAIITMDIRQFHHLNTVLGIRNCNLLLEEIAHFLYQLAGKTNVFQEGDTFSLIIEPPLKSKDVIQKIEKRFSEEWSIHDNHIMVDIVMVCERWPGEFQTVADFFDMQEYMFSSAKKAEKQSVLMADKEFLAAFDRRRQIEATIQKALHENHLEVRFQPIYSTKEKRIVSLEALAWLEDETIGVIPQEELISIAEKNGSILLVGEIVLEESCKFLAKRVLANTSLGIHSLQIHLSVVQCMKQNLKEAIFPVLEKYHVPPAMIMFEITEQTAIGAPALMLHHMRELEACGITFALSKYGSGNSNCSYLVRFPFKEVKIDKEIIWPYFENETVKIILENEIKTMKMLGIPIVAEGMETAEENEEMEQFDVEYMQGSYYGKPMAEKECLRYIRNVNEVAEEFGRV